MNKEVLIVGHTLKELNNKVNHFLVKGYIIHTEPFEVVPNVLYRQTVIKPTKKKE